MTSPTLFQASDITLHLFAPFQSSPTHASASFRPLAQKESVNALTLSKYHRNQTHFLEQELFEVWETIGEIITTIIVIVIVIVIKFKQL